MGAAQRAASQRLLAGGSARRGASEMPYVYLLKSLKDFKQYIGSTPDLNRRLKQHNRGEVISTRNRRPLRLVALGYCETIQEAAELEKKYKRSHGALERAIKSGKVKVVDNGE